MTYISYVPKRFQGSSLDLIDSCLDIISLYEFPITLRQLYYQLVSKGMIPNEVKEYKRLGSIVNDARLAGLISWEAIEDRTRNLVRIPQWNSAEDFKESAIPQFHLDHWENQEVYVQVWVEKDALSGVVAHACNPFYVPYFSCRGYTSQSEMWVNAMRLIEQNKKGKPCVVLHLGDHDPSGIDMTRDITERLKLFGASVMVFRLALNMNQIKAYNPPPNPAKETDARFLKYYKEFGESCWELDALEPNVIQEMITAAIERIIDKEKWDEIEKQEEEQRELLWK
jgi:hypothetical protein